MENICTKAIKDAGGPAALAKEIGGLTSQAVSQWKKVPAERVLEVERVTGISRHQLRPDVFGAATPAPISEAAQ
ncbi:helix-turn-helix domain-containing protein [Rhizobium sp. VS19-DR104.2]|uniref:transcriptional regulator n=1 Tax=unclassified Rhizobium TaxID=2613769 RepID=UPI001CC7364A|nr:MULTISPECIES: Cro/CI family transcriptional regulator [unclassified Rhizobium]MBZ5761546.1 helix-turn-helix domain-containing protein [Rhizobium sp. VS19-DR96]MBZ5767494.1 helix-turn-helix domain-containing protein [Rhizobium sp. VS19-DR129.2]MBZ5775057.1 helix-turn-helix domain-containing protein [Rhizobium sp. VS19-DRK62.2]MBZ5785978.1 helix-turn-helix domain-containing protein [Rhizobium sp. VS19-DR121]MBZ5803404.1 helix-turn-helix domain-containing protein [Rhizobium sp. VS19-DR181]